MKRGGAAEAGGGCDRLWQVDALRDRADAFRRETASTGVSAKLCSYWELRSAAQIPWHRSSVPRTDLEVAPPSAMHRRSERRLRLGCSYSPPYSQRLALL